jgi:hypothetical protein
MGNKQTRKIIPIIEPQQNNQNIIVDKEINQEKIKSFNDNDKINIIQIKSNNTIETQK